MRCPVRVHVGSDCAEPSQACQVGRPATTTRPCVLCVTVASACNVKRKSTRTIQRAATDGLKKMASADPRQLYADFCNKIGAKQTFSEKLTPGMPTPRDPHRLVGTSAGLEFFAKSDTRQEFSGLREA